MCLLDFWEMQITQSMEMCVCAWVSALNITLVPILKAVWSRGVLGNWYICMVLSLESLGFGFWGVGGIGILAQISIPLETWLVS